MDFDRVIKRGTAFVFTPTLALIPSYASSLLFVLSHLISLFYRAEPCISPARRADFRTCSGNGFIRFARGNYCDCRNNCSEEFAGRFVIAVYREPMCSYRFLSSRHNFYLVSSGDTLSLFLSFSRIHTRESHAPPPANFYLIYPCFLFLFFFFTLLSTITF